ncbi:hypothetical protein J6590_033541 [Homalodisca vitripennis]|nr:hypothetical protein J6590_033541 [Homalodisca vitripennis]
MAFPLFSPSDRYVDQTIHDGRYRHLYVMTVVNTGYFCHLPFTPLFHADAANTPSPATATLRVTTLLSADAGVTLHPPVLIPHSTDSRPQYSRYYYIFCEPPIFLVSEPKCLRCSDLMVGLSPVSYFRPRPDLTVVYLILLDLSPAGPLSPLSAGAGVRRNNAGSRPISEQSTVKRTRAALFLALGRL